MANNRIYLRCKACGQKLYLGKSLGTGFVYENYTPEKGTLAEKLNEFFCDHTFCCNSKMRCALCKTLEEGCFEIECEQGISTMPCNDKTEVGDG